MAKFKKPLLFALCLLPIAAVAGIFSAIYQFDMLSEEYIAQAVEQYGSREAILALTTVQTVVYAFFCGFFGCFLAEKTGLWRPIRLERKKVLVTLGVSVVFGALLSLDSWTFGAVIDGLRESNAATVTASGIAASVLYGGIVEELMLRLFFLSLLAFLLWKLFFRKYAREEIPERVFVIANMLAAFLFAAGHLPATAATFGTLTPLLLLRCFLMNGAGGLVFGRLYRKYGIVYAMMSHALFHVVIKTVWFLFR